MQHKVVLTFESLDKISMKVQMKAIEQHFPVVLFVMLQKVFITLKCLGEILNCDQSNF